MIGGMFRKEGWDQNCESGLLIPARSFGLYLEYKKGPEKIRHSSLCFQDGTSAGGMKEGLGRESWEEGIQR